VITIPSADSATSTSKILDVGVHDVTVTAAEEVTSRNNTPGFKLTLANNDGADIWDFIYVTDKTLWKVNQVLDALGHTPANGQLDVNKLVGLRATITIDTEVYDGKTRNRVTEYSAPAEPGGGTPTIPVAEDDIPF
jgi:hypothetical protein